MKLDDLPEDVRSRSDRSTFAMAAALALVGAMLAVHTSWHLQLEEMNGTAVHRHSVAIGVWSTAALLLFEVGAGFALAAGVAARPDAVRTARALTLFAMALSLVVVLLSALLQPL
jgi:hypothetical protein